MQYDERIVRKMRCAILSLNVGSGNRSAPLSLSATSSIGTACLLTDSIHTHSSTKHVTPFPLVRTGLGERQVVPTSSARISSIRVESNAETTSSKDFGVKFHATLDVPVPSSTPNSKLRRNQGWRKTDHHHHQTLELVAVPEPISLPTTPRATVTPLSTLCPAGNGTTYMSNLSIEYQVICDVDFPDNDHPFLLVDSLDSCVQACDAFNIKAGSKACLAALFVPSRLLDSDDCYLKSSVNHSTVATVAIEGVVLVTSKTSTSTSISPTVRMKSNLPVKDLGAPSASTTSPLSLRSSLPTLISTTSITSSRVSSNTVVANSGPGVDYASGNTLIIPKVASSQSRMCQARNISM